MKSCRCIVVSPTRELAIQIYNEARKFVYGTILAGSVEIAYGQVKVDYQVTNVKNVSGLREYE